VRADVVVLLEPSIDDHLCLSGGREPFGAEQLAPQCAGTGPVVRDGRRGGDGGSGAGGERAKPYSHIELGFAL
jgi:hypothetical protein